MKVKGYFLLLASLLILASCGKQEKSNGITENGSVVEDTQSKPTPEANIQEDSIYSENDMFAICDAIESLLDEQWNAVGVSVKCYPTLEDDSMLIIALIESVDKSKYTDDELLKLLQENRIEEGFINLPNAIMRDYELDNVVLSLDDKNGEMLYLFHNGDKLFQVGDKSYNLSVKLITPKEK